MEKKYSVLLNVYAVVEASSEEEARKKFWEKPMAHYIDGTDIIVDVEEHAITEISE